MLKWYQFLASGIPKEEYCAKTGSGIPIFSVSKQFLKFLLRSKNLVLDCMYIVNSMTAEKNGMFYFTNSVVFNANYYVC